MRLYLEQKGFPGRLAVQFESRDTKHRPALPFLGICPKTLGYGPVPLALRIWSQPLGFGPKVSLLLFSRISAHYFPYEDIRQQPTDGDDRKGPHLKQTGAGNQRKGMREVRAVTNERRLLRRKQVVRAVGTAKLQTKWG